MIRRINQKGLDLIKDSEGFRAKPYKCPAGYWTVGYGHRIRFPHERKHYKKHPLTLDDAERLLINDLKSREVLVQSAVEVPLTDNQFAALVDFTYNFGSNAFLTSTLLRLLNAGDYVGAADEFPRWKHGGRPKKVIRGLIKRRAREREMFLGGEPCVTTSPKKSLKTNLPTTSQKATKPNDMKKFAMRLLAWLKTLYGFAQKAGS